MSRNIATVWSCGIRLPATQIATCAAASTRHAVTTSRWRMRNAAWIVAGVLTKQIERDREHEYPAPVADPSGFRVAARFDGAEMVQALLKEILKQAVDQPGHFLIAAFPIWLSRRLTGVPWYGWPVVPLLAYREWLQWPSNRWWDPPLDWAFLALGIIVARGPRSSRRAVLAHGGGMLCRDGRD